LIKILFITDGLLVKEYQNDKSFSKYGVIIVDEAHERTQNTDILLAYLKNNKRKDLKVIIMIATISVGKFGKYYNCKSIC
jgi:HrpA-like RNA helicase